MKGYGSHSLQVVELAGNLALDEIDGPQLEFLMQEMHRLGWKPSTIRNRLAALVGMVKLAQRRGYVAARPLPIRRPRITLASRPDAYARQEVAALVAAAKGWARRAVLLAADAGLRRSEIVRVRKDDLHRGSLTLTVPVRDEEDRPKSGKARTIPVTKRLAAAIASGPHGLVLGADGPRTADALSKAGIDVWAAAGVAGGARWHRLRHYWASRLANEGKATPWELMEWGGWSSLEMVKRYYHAPLRLNRRPVAALERRPTKAEMGHERSTAARALRTGGSRAPRKAARARAK